MYVGTIYRRYISTTSQLIQSVINLLELSENTYLSTYLPTYIFSVTTYIQYGTYIHTYLGT